MTTVTSAPAVDSAKRLQCLEVWGGNRFVSTSVQMPGLDAWVYSMPADGQESVGGGDVHYVSSCVAGTARALRKLMQRHVNHHAQTGFVRALNEQFTALAQTGRFATAVAFTFD